MAQAQVAQEMRVVQSTVSAWERGSRRLPSDRASELDELFGSSGAMKQAWNSANTPDSLPPWYTEVGQLEREATVVPADAECHPGGSGPFCAYTFPDKPMVASAEHMKGEALMDDMMQIQHRAMLFGVLQAEALSPRASRELSRKVKEELDEQA
ncbi:MULTISPECIES: Scr1 family TA system antitoxin-like transcriptional regulator [unclassified Nocardiopsis]|uniref:Scr1 family TA system antitoxin-like transcriptional regulator n=1 Tax=unclassified Nocardiopsis TaxID=2649073 RepID=UPI00135B12D5|nr:MULTISPECIES: Scr1 family TA system antitoxin-like transcriptional regulator [unclassified Nocardiopsis]